MLKKTLLLCSLFAVFSCKAKQQTQDEISYADLINSHITGQQAYETTAYVEQFWRVVGNDGFNKSIYKIAEGLKAAGYVLEEKASSTDRLTYRIEKWPMKRPTWEPVDASVQIKGVKTNLLEFKTNRNMIYQNSPSTSFGGATGEVVFIKDKADLSKTDLKGKIVFGEMSYYNLFAEAKKQGAIGLLTYNNPKYLQPEKNVTSIQFRGMRYAEDNKIWAVALSYAAKEQLKKALSKGKVELDVKITTKIYPSEELTIVADVKGSSIPKERLVFSAHVQEPGANDNATGVGTQLEMASTTAKLIKENKIDIKRTLTYLWGDEIRSTARYITTDSIRAANIKWGISLDMVGENTAVTGGSFLIEKMPDPSAIWTRGNDKHSEWGGSKMTLEQMKPHYLNDFIIGQFKAQGARANWEVNTNPFEGGSDHTPFLRNNIPGLLLWHFTDQFYHTDNDRLDKVSKETMKNVGTGALISALILLNADAQSGRDLLKDIEKAAYVRLKDELALSTTAVTGGKSSVEEEGIIDAWLNWYLETFDTVNDVNSTNDASLKKDIETAKEKLSAHVKLGVDALKKL